MTGSVDQALAHLEDALAAATAGEWEQDYEYPSDVVVLADGRDTIAAASRTHDAAAIVAAVNLAPALLGLARDVQQIVDELDNGVRELAEEAEGTSLEDLRRNQLLARALGKASAASRLRAALAAHLAPTTPPEDQP